MTSALAKTPAAIASAVLIAVLSGCGGGEGANSAYCKDLSTSAPTFAAFRTGDTLGDIFKAVQASHHLAAEAPDQVKKDWKVLDAAMTVIDHGLRDAGLKPSNLDEYQAGKIPEGVKIEKLQGLSAKFLRLDRPEFRNASKAIAQHARDVCKVTFES